MKPDRVNSKWIERWVRLSVAAWLLLAAVGCNFTAKEDNNNSSGSLQQTQVALSVAQTLQAERSNGSNATIAAQQATMNAQSSLATQQASQAQAQQTTAAIQADSQATAQSAQATAQAAAVQPPAQQPVQPAAPQFPTQPAIQPPAQPPVQPPASAGNFKELMKSASVLLFEDMVSDPTETRYVKKTLDAMGIRYKDDGNAIGWLKSDMLSNAPNGKPWDLVIIAVEARSDVSGEYFNYLNDVLNQGSSVILEAWHLDSISEGTVSTILSRCGVIVYPYFPKSGTVNDVLLWPLPGMSSHPLLSDPRSTTRFTRARDKWLFSFDLGSLMALNGTGDAVLLLGTKADEPYKNGTLASCMAGQLILQTFSSHSFPYDVVGPLWENYITNALRKRFSGGS